MDLLTSWIRENYQVGAEDGGTLVVAKKGRRSGAVVVEVAVTRQDDDGIYEYGAEVKGIGAGSKVLVATQAVYDGGEAITRLSAAHVKRLAKVLSEVGAKKATKKKAPPGKAWFDKIDLYRGHGAHVINGRIYMTDGYQIVHAEMAGKPPKNACVTGESCTVQSGIVRILKGVTNAKERVEVDPEECCRMLRAMKVLQMNADGRRGVVLEVRRSAIWCAASAPGGESGTWVVDLKEPRKEKSKAVRSEFDIDFLLPMVRYAGGRMEITPREDPQDPWGFDGAHYRAVLMPMVRE